MAFRLPKEGIDWLVAIPFTVARIAGVLIAGLIAARLSAARPSKWFVWLLVIVAGYTAAQSVMGK